MRARCGAASPYLTQSVPPSLQRTPFRQSYETRLAELDITRIRIAALAAFGLFRAGRAILDNEQRTMDSKVRELWSADACNSDAISARISLITSLQRQLRLSRSDKLQSTRYHHFLVRTSVLGLETMIQFTTVNTRHMYAHQARLSTEGSAVPIPLRSAFCVLRSAYVQRNLQEHRSSVTCCRIGQGLGVPVVIISNSRCEAGESEGKCSVDHCSPAILLRTLKGRI